jgi:hypothetical protein
MANKRPLTQREIMKRTPKADDPAITIYNNTNNIVQIQIREPGKDFYVSEQTIRIPPKKSYRARADYFNSHQLQNLKERGEIKVLMDTEKK